MAGSLNIENKMRSYGKVKWKTCSKYSSGIPY